MMESDQESAVPPRSRLLQSKPRVSGWALASLMTSLLCIPLVPIILGIVALRKIRSSGGRIWGTGLAVTGLVLGLGLIVFIGLMIPEAVKMQKKAARSMATSNLKQMGLALMDFETEYGSLPSREIYRRYPEKFPNATDGDSANDLLGLLLAGGIVDSEEIFYAKGGSRFRKKPDNVFDAPDKLLEPGECGFGYVMLEGGVPLSTGVNDAACPVLVAPLMPGSGGADPKFNPKPYDGMAVYLRIDQAVKSAPLDESLRVRVPGSRHTLFGPDSDISWGGKAPEVHPPE